MPDYNTVLYCALSEKEHCRSLLTCSTTNRWMNSFFFFRSRETPNQMTNNASSILFMRDRSIHSRCVNCFPVLRFLFELCYATFHFNVFFFFFAFFLLVESFVLDFFPLSLFFIHFDCYVTPLHIPSLINREVDYYLRWFLLRLLSFTSWGWNSANEKEKKKERKKQSNEWN